MPADEVVDQLPSGTAPPLDLVLSYGDGPQRVVDVRVPSGPGPHRVAVVLHGGFWRAAYDRAHTGPMCADLVARGWLTCAPEYHRIGHAEGGWPGTFLDVAAALDALPDLLSAAGLPTAGPGVLLGHSAGGHLALWAAARRALPAGAPGASPEPYRPEGVLALAPVADLAEAARLGLSNGVVRELLGGGPVDVPERYAVADPVRLLPSGVPTVIVHGDGDAVVPPEIGMRYAEVARAAGDPVSLRQLPGTGHFGLIDPRSAAWPEVLTALAGL